MTTQKPTPRPAPKKWTIENGRYSRLYGRSKLATERSEEVSKRIQQEVKEGKRKPVKVRVDF